MRCSVLRAAREFAIVDTAGQYDNKRAREVCASFAPGEIVVFDKAYVDFAHLAELDARVFITNNLAWSPRSVCDLYRRRWHIEVFFKQVKQSLKQGNRQVSVISLRAALASLP